LLHKAAVQLDEFDDNLFDAVNATLVFSKLQLSEQRYVLAHIHRILKPEGVFILADEVIPSNFLKRIVYRLISAPLALFTYLFTQTSTMSVKNLVHLVEDAGFQIIEIKDFQLGAFKIVCVKKKEDAKAIELKVPLIDPPKYNIFCKFWEIAMRFIGHETQIGLIAVSNPDQDSPILCIRNFKLTVYRLYKFLNKKKINAWLLVAPSTGINVWCAACGSEFNSSSMIIAIKISGLEKYVNHRKIILLKFIIIIIFKNSLFYLYLIIQINQIFLFNILF